MKKIYSLFLALLSKIKETEKKKVASVTFILISTFAIGIYACCSPSQNVEENTVVSVEVKEEVDIEHLPESVPEPVSEAPAAEPVPAEPVPEPAPEAPPVEEKQEPEKITSDAYTCLLTVPDKGGARTDMIMLIVFRVNEKAIDLISVPRDTKVDGKKINAVAIKKGKLDIELLASKVTNLTGINIDTYMFVDIECVKKTVDMFGGVMFDVKQNMYYEDPYQNLYISLEKGKQLINGHKAEQLLRFRKYRDGDLGRTAVQREFMIEAFKQHAKIENLSKIPQWYEMADGHIRTNMTPEGMLAIAQTVVDGSFKVNSRIMPHSLSDGYVICNKNEMTKMAKELGY